VSPGARPGAPTTERERATTDVLVVGAGPGGTTAATFLARGGLNVTVVEREAFPRFRVGESLVPNCMPILNRLGIEERVLAHGFQRKYGATFHDQELDLEAGFRFREGRPWPKFTLDVHRAEFDQMLLEHAAAQGVTVLQPATVEKVLFDADGVTVRVAGADGEREVRARFLVDASGRDAFLASRQGQRTPMPGLGKVAVFAYYRGAKRFPGNEEGDVRIYIFPDGWFWYIPLAHDETSVGCVMHARVAKSREGSMPELLDAMIERCHRVRDNVRGAERVTQVYTASHFAYDVEPIVGDRFLCVGDAVGFVDAIFSPGVFIAMASGEMAAGAVLEAFRTGRFQARRFRPYRKRVLACMAPFRKFILAFYDRAFLDVFLRPRDFLGMLDAVTMVLAGGSYTGVPWKMRLSLAGFFQIIRIARWINRRKGVPLESRLEW